MGVTERPIFSMAFRPMSPETRPDRRARTKRKPEQKQAVRTDRQGLATIDLKHAGVWLIKAVEMVRYDKAGADWISYWASMTFRL